MPKKGYQQSGDHKQKIKIANSSRLRSEETKRKISTALKGKTIGRHLSIKHKYKISIALKGKHPSEETKCKISISNSGKVVSEETKHKMSLSHKHMRHPRKIRTDNGIVILGFSSDEERFLSWTKRLDNGCLIWEGSNNGRYGVFFHSHTREYSHRWAYRHFVSDFNKELLICHHCDTPLCVEPSHLFAGTSFDNLRDAAVKGRLSTSKHRKLKSAKLEIINAIQ